jgi:hypothetical protein
MANLSVDCQRLLKATTSGDRISKTQQLVGYVVELNCDTVLVANLTVDLQTLFVGFLCAFVITLKTKRDSCHRGGLGDASPIACRGEKLF